MGNETGWKVCFTHLHLFPLLTKIIHYRYLEEFKKEREGIEFFDFCNMPDKCCEVTLQPIRKFDFDASIIFSDILVLPQVLGMECEMLKSVGPNFVHPISTPDDFYKLLQKCAGTETVDDGFVPKIGGVLDKVYDAIFVTRFRLNGVVPLFGFTGGPWTLATYMIEGNSPQKCLNSKKWIYEHPEDFKRLIYVLTQLIIEHMVNQVTAGAQMLQLFESNIGELSEDDFTDFLLQPLTDIVDGIKAKYPSIPVFIFPRGSHFCYEALSTTKYDAISIDWTDDLAKVRTRVGDRVTLQGNLEPSALYGSDELIRAKTKKMIDKAGKTKYVCNLGWGMLPDHNPDKLAVFIDACHSHKFE